MHEAVYHFSTEAGWRLRTLLRTSRYHTSAVLVRLFKCNVLSFIEGATPAIYHSAPSTLQPLDAVFYNFLEQIGMSLETALIEHSLAPLGMRRDIAMLGLLHKVALGSAPQPILDLFRSTPLNSFSVGLTSSRLRHNMQIHDPVEFNHPGIIKRSVFGLIRVYNDLPQYVVSAKTAKVLQRRLQKRAKVAAVSHDTNWPLMFHAS
jgi:hypothetical protein